MKQTIALKSIQGFIILFIVVAAGITSCKDKPAPTPLPEQKPVVSEVKESKSGLASFYGRAFDGKKTYSGETFDSDEMVAAHPSYPIGTIVRVTNLSTQDTIRVRISDRGPTSANRKEGVIIDLSLGAAKKINMVAAGREQVKVEVLEWGKR